MSEAGDANLRGGAVVTRYSAVAIVLHWAIAVLLLLNIVVAWRFDAMVGMAKFQAYQFHKSTGILVLLLSLMRLGWRLLHPAPPYPAGLKPREQLLARVVHIGFYVVMIGLPLSGWAMVSSSKTNLPTVIYGLLPWPHLGFISGASEAARHSWHEASEFAHDALGKLTYGLIAMHVLGAVKHQFIDKDVIMARMAPWFARR